MRVMGSASDLLHRVTERPGFASSAAMAASGIAIALMPGRTSEALQISAVSSRGVAELRAGVGGTFAALGVWAMLRQTSDAYTAVGVTWLGAAVVRVLALRVDEPETDLSFWAFLTGEVTLGAAGLVDGGRR
jgi:hypothetical protein